VRDSGIAERSQASARRADPGETVPGLIDVLSGQCRRSNVEQFLKRSRNLSRRFRQKRAENIF
jgi:hypothetical protein